MHTYTTNHKNTTYTDAHISSYHSCAHIYNHTMYTHTPSCPKQDKDSKGVDWEDHPLSFTSHINRKNSLFSPLLTTCFLLFINYCSKTRKRMVKGWMGRTILCLSLWQESAQSVKLLIYHHFLFKPN